MLDLAKLGYKSLLEEGGACISIPAAVTVPKETATDRCIREGWALKCSKKAYRFNAQQKAYLDAKFAIGQTTGKKLDGDTVAREMRRALGPDGVRLFRVSEFLTPQQISAYFSRRAAKIRQQPPNDVDIRASEEEDNFARARETVMAITLQHPITFDQYDICDMAKNGSLERLKLGRLQSICQNWKKRCHPSQFAAKKSFWTKLRKSWPIALAMRTMIKISSFATSHISITMNELCATETRDDFKSLLKCLFVVVISSHRFAKFTVTAYFVMLLLTEVAIPL